MNLFGIDNSQQAAPLFRMTGTEQPARTEAGPGAEPSAEPARASSGTSIMAGHFVHAHRQESQYISGLKAGLAAQNNLMTRMQSVITGYQNIVDLTATAMELQGKKMTYAQKILLGEKAADDIETMIDDEVSDTNNEKIEDIREDIEEKAEEAVAPESQDVLENEASPQEELEDSLDEAAPEAEDGQAATEPEANAEPIAAAEDRAGQDATAQQAPPGEAPATPSIDLVV